MGDSFDQMKIDPAVDDVGWGRHEWVRVAASTAVTRTLPRFISDLRHINDRS